MREYISPYASARGSNAWISIEGDKKFTRTRKNDSSIEAIASIADVLNLPCFGSFVSFGPGIGASDIKAMQLMPHEANARYLPIDISSYLLEISVNSVIRAFPNFDVSKRLHLDFETAGAQLEKEFRELRFSNSSLFMMLGSTFGNLRLGERNFLSLMERIMRKGDYFLFDMTFADHDYAFNKDPYCNLETLEDVIKDFFLNVTREYMGPDASLNDLNAKEITSSDIENTKGVELCTRAGDLVISLKRYNKTSLLGALHDLVSIDTVASRFYGTEMPGISRGTLVLAKK